MVILKTILMVMILVTLGSFNMVYAQSDPPFDSCFNSPDPTICGFTSNPFEAILDVFDQIMPGFGVLLLWGPVIFGLWYKTQKPEIAGFAGVIIVATVTGLHPAAVSIGILLLAASLGISFIGIFQRIKQTA